APALGRLEISPLAATFEEPTTAVQLRVLASFGDGITRDVTHLARFSVNNDSVATVTPAGRVEKVKHGEVAVAAQYMDRVASTRIVFLSAAPQFVWRDPPEHNYVDRLVFAKLRQMRIEPSGLCTDAEFIRRVTLDLTGQLPTPDEVRHFIGSDNAEKR